MNGPRVEKLSISSGMGVADLMEPTFAEAEASGMGVADTIEPTNAIGPCPHMDPCQKFQLGDGKTAEICIHPDVIYVGEEHITTYQYGVKFKF